jgi:hypothetical protein
MTSMVPEPARAAPSGISTWCCDDLQSWPMRRRLHNTGLNPQRDSWTVTRPFSGDNGWAPGGLLSVIPTLSHPSTSGSPPTC